MLVTEYRLNKTRRVMAIYLTYAKSWERMKKEKHHIFVPPEITTKSLVQSRQLICKEKLSGDSCAFWYDDWSGDGDWDNDRHGCKNVDDACKRCSAPKITNYEFSRLLWGEHKDGLVVDVSVLRRYVRGAPMKFDRYREVIRSLLDHSITPRHIAAAEWEQLIELEAFVNLFLSVERRFRIRISDHRSFLLGFSSRRLTFASLTRFNFSADPKIDEMRRCLFSDRDLQVEIKRVRQRLQKRVDASNQQEAIARLVGE